HVLTMWDGKKGVDINLDTRHVAFGVDATYAVSRDWRLYTIADNQARAVGETGEIVHAATDYTSHHACVSQRSGGVACTGTNLAGELGTGDTESNTTFTSVPGISGSQRVAIGAYHSCTLTTAGEVYCWGSNHAGQLGVTLGVVSTEILRGKSGSKAVVVRDNGANQPNGSMCRLPREVSARAVPCSLTPVRVTL
ncbi:MAG: hypothetical protein H7Z43_12575, partial [Clostridia bacterium]|nr:hypothetical protein [Deltaproteobacteria bacterium]